MVIRVSGLSYLINEHSPYVYLFHEIGQLIAKIMSDVSSALAFSIIMSTQENKINITAQ